MSRWKFGKTSRRTTDELRQDKLLHTEACAALREGLDPTGMTAEEIAEMLYPQDATPEPEPEQEILEARSLVAELFGHATAAAAVSEEECVGLLEAAINTGLIKLSETEDRIMEFLLREPEVVGWPQPRIGTLVTAEPWPLEAARRWGEIYEVPQFVDYARWGNTIVVSQNSAVVEAAYQKEIVVSVIRCAGTKRNGAPCRNRVKAEGGYCRFHVPATQRVREAIARQVEKVVAVHPAMVFLDKCPMDEKGYHHAPSGHSFYLVHQIQGIVQSFRTLKAVHAYIVAGWSVTLQPIEA